MKNEIILISCIVLPFFSNAQYTPADSITKQSEEMVVLPLTKSKSEKRIAVVKSLIIPAGLIGYGFAALGNNSMHTLNRNTKSELQEDHPQFLTKVDNYLQYAPAVAVYGLNAMGIKGKNNFRDRTIIYFMSTAIAGITVTSLKKLTKVERPDGSGNNSFPSGHTTTAFASAEFLRMEYKDVSPWYGIAGYATAAATGILRLYNNKHWVNDIVAGAGFGILSTKLSYWIYPVIKKKLFKDKAVSTFASPYYQSGNIGISVVHNFH